jgi:hypothetical protein
VLGEHEYEKWKTGERILKGWKNDVRKRRRTRVTLNKSNEMIGRVRGREKAERL